MVAEEQRDKWKEDVARAASITGAIFAAIISADPFDVRHRTTWVRVVDYVAIALWVLTVMLFLLAIAGSRIPKREARASRQLFVRLIDAISSLKVVAWLGEAIKSLTLAICSLVAATIATIVALSAVASNVSLDRDSVALRLTPLERHAVDELCGTRGMGHLRGTVPTPSLENAFVIFKFAEKTPRGCDELRIPASGIRLIEEHPR